MGLFGFELALFFGPLQSKNWLCSAKKHVCGAFDYPAYGADAFMVMVSQVICIHDVF